MKVPVMKLQFPHFRSGSALLTALFVSLVLLCPFVYELAQAQQMAPEGEELSMDPNSKTDSAKQKYLTLYIGIEHQEKLPFWPDGGEPRGDYKRVTEIKPDRTNGVIIFTPKKVGIATLSIHGKTGQKIYEFRIDVKKSDLTKVAREMRELLGDIEGISIKIVNNRVVVDGQVLLPRDVNRIHSVVKQYEGQASTIVTLSPIAQRKIAQMIENDIRNPEITVRAINDRFILEGMANSESEKNRAYTIAQMYVPNVIVEEAVRDGVVQQIRRDFVINLIEVKQAPPPEPGKIIQLVIHFVELNRSYEKGFRFQWTPNLSDESGITFGNSSNNSNSGIVTSITGTVSNLLPKLNWAKKHGHARVLQSSTLLIQDGSEGNLRSQTRIPYQILNQQGQAGVQFAEAGLVTKVQPRILNARSDSIQLVMDFGVSNYLGSDGGAPIIANNSMQTQIVVRSGQSAAVGGLISSSSNTDYNKFPKDGPDNPILSLYASKNFQRNQSQFVVFVTPIIKSSASAGAEKVKKKFRLRD
ncbi:MAG: BON domain-containing protein [Bdellovibrionaceae bacterium]|nr:BON domain-containing protein [Pseudobdellovibrionaceae bacterium]